MHLLAVGEAEEALLYIQRNLVNCISVLNCSRVRKISSVQRTHSTLYFSGVLVKICRFADGTISLKL